MSLTLTLENNSNELMNFQETSLLWADLLYNEVKISLTLTLENDRNELNVELSRNFTTVDRSPVQ